MAKNLTKRQVIQFTRLYMSQIARLGNHDFYSGVDLTHEDIENVFAEIQVFGNKLRREDDPPVGVQELVDYVRGQF